MKNVAFLRPLANINTAYNNSVFLAVFFSSAKSPETSAALGLSGIAAWSQTTYRDPPEIRKATKKNNILKIQLDEFKTRSTLDPQN